MSLNRNLVVIESFTRHGIKYTVDITEKTCTCLSFRRNSARPCKHLLSIPNLYPSDAFPKPSEAVSAFIKSVRLRSSQDAILWLTYMWQASADRARIQRRILISSGEDNISAGVMESVAKWYRGPEKKSLLAAAIEVLRICQTLNWYAQPDGRSYIYAFRKAEISSISFKGYSLTDLYEKLHSAILRKEITTGLAAFNALYSRRDFRPKEFSIRLQEWCEIYGEGQSKLLAKIYVDCVPALWLDGNTSGQAYYSLFVGPFGNQQVPEPDTSKAAELIEQALLRLNGPIAVPAIARDGIHTKTGNDRRFAGIVSQMSGCCRAYEHYSRLSPDDVWLPEFMELPDQGVEG